MLEYTNKLLRHSGMYPNEDGWGKYLTKFNIYVIIFNSYENKMVQSYMLASKQAAVNGPARQPIHRWNNRLPRGSDKEGS